MQADQAIRIIVAEQDALTRAGLVAILKESIGGAVVESVPSLDRAIPLLSSSRGSDVLVVNADMLGASPDQTVHALRRGFPGARVAVLARTMNRDLILALLSAGTHGCIPLDLDPSILATVFQSVVAGQVYVPPLLSDVERVGEWTAPYQAEHVQELTERQVQVLQLMATGNSNKQIARQLGIAEGTVKIHMHAAFKVLGVHNRVSALAAIAELEEGNGGRQPLLPGFDKARRGATDLLVAFTVLSAGCASRMLEIAALA